MPIVFIDANIYLDPYRRKMENYRELLEGLREIEPYLLVTRTVRDEVERNRLTAYSANNKIEKPKPKSDLVEMRPHHAQDTAEVDEINKNVRRLENELATKAGALHEQLKKVHHENLVSILNGDDDVSLAIKPIFEKAVSETPEQLNRARLRKEKGQPPGKRTDPLGDQISWEQLLDAAKRKGTIWLVTRDRDYTATIGEEVYLDPSLRREVSTVDGVSEVKCFDNLADFFTEFRKAGVVNEDQLPPQETVNAAKEEVVQQKELASALNARRMRDLQIALENRDLGWPPICKKSPTGKHQVDGTAARPSGVFGGWTYQGLCTACGSLVDTGEPYDD